MSPWYGKSFEWVKHSVLWRCILKAKMQQHCCLTTNALSCRPRPDSLFCSLSKHPILWAWPRLAKVLHLYPNVWKTICSIHCSVKYRIKRWQPIKVKKCRSATMGGLQTWPPTHQLQEMNSNWVGHLSQDKVRLPNIFSPFVSPSLFQWIPSIGG